MLFLLGRNNFPFLASKKADKCWSSLDIVNNYNREIRRVTAIEIIQILKKKAVKNKKGR